MSILCTDGILLGLGDDQVVAERCFGASGLVDAGVCRVAEALEGTEAADTVVGDVAAEHIVSVFALECERGELAAHLGSVAAAPAGLFRR